MLQYLQALKTAIAQSDSPLPTDVHLGLLAQTLGTELRQQVAYDDQRYCFSFTKPIPARELCRAMGWSRPYAFSPDVHQTTWAIGLWRADLADPYRPRIAIGSPRLGKWAVCAHLNGRPAGELPNLAAGASPAYDLWAFSAEVTEVDVDLWNPDIHR